NTISDNKNIKNAQDTRKIIEPTIGIKSMIQMINDIMRATCGVIKSNPARETKKKMMLTRNCAFKKPRMTSESRSFINETFRAVSSVSKWYAFVFKTGNSSINKNKAIK